MIALLGRIFIKDAGEYHNPHVRRMYGMLCSIVGITLNIILFGIKFLLVQLRVLWQLWQMHLIILPMQALRLLH